MMYNSGSKPTWQIHISIQPIGYCLEFAPNYKCGVVPRVICKDSIRYKERGITMNIRQRVILVLGSLMALALLAAPTQVFAQCAGDVGIANDGVDSGGLPGFPDYRIENLPETVNWTVTPASGGVLDIEVSEVVFALTCANNGDGVPCENGNDGQDGNNAETPFIYTQSGDPTGTCGATFASNAAGVVTFQMPPGSLDQTGCTIIFETQLVDKGIDSSPNLVTSAAAFEGTCLDGDLVGSAAGAALVEVHEPAIAIEKRVRDPATGLFVDADTAPGPTYLVGATVEYQLEVCNTGNVDLTDVTVDDANLGIIGANIGSLLAGQCVSLEEGVLPTGIPGLDSTTACADPGPFMNTAVSTGTPESGPPDVTDSDLANVFCAAPSIDIEKRVRDPASGLFVDADTAPGPTYLMGATVEYQLEVCNTGNVDLTDVTVDDANLGIIGANIGSLLAGQCVSLEEGVLPTGIPGLDSTTACADPGPFMNTAVSTGTPESGPPDVTDSDLANVECAPPPEIDILKEVSVDGGTTWYDASLPADFPPAVAYPAGAMYRITVFNTGQVDLVNVTVDDPVLGIAGYLVGDLAAGASVLLTSGDIPALDVAVRCTSVGTFTNISFANGDSALTGTAAPEAEDPASMVCAIDIAIPTLSQYGLALLALLMLGMGMIGFRRFA